MKSIIFKIILIALFSVELSSQVEIPLFNKMEGTWERMYDNDSVKNIKEDIYTFWLFNHNFFEIQTWNSSDTGRTFQELYVLTRNNEGNIIGWSMDKKGYKCMMNFKVNVEGDKITLEGKNDCEETSISYYIKDKSLTRKIRTITKDKKEIYSETIFYNNKPENMNVYYLSSKYELISEPGLAYVSHISNHFVSVINTKNNELIGKINCSNGSIDICFPPDKKIGYIANFNSNNINVFDRKTNEVINTVEAGEHPANLLSVQDGKYVLISHESQDGIWVLDASKNLIVKKLQEGTGPLYLIEQENKIYQPQIFIPFLFVIDPNTFEITKKVETGGRPMSMAFINGKRYAYMANLDFNEITKFDTRNDSIIGHIKDVNYPRGIASTKNGKFIYVTDVVENKVYVINTDMDYVIAKIEGFGGPTSVDISMDDKYAYVTNQGVGDRTNNSAAQTISVIEISSNKIIKSIKVADNPINIFIDKE